MKAEKKKLFMWYKVKELSEQGLNKSQISESLKIARKTVRSYLKMDESGFQIWFNKSKNLPKKLAFYRNYVVELLYNYPYLSAAQVEDRLKEQYRDLPEIHSKTVYNFVESIRREHGIKKPKGAGLRLYEKQSELPYGLGAQVDFGEFNMLTLDTKTRKKIYFFAMVLSRSRQKFVHLQDRPFTSVDTIMAHEKAFAFYDGIPTEILYDQDRVLLVNENMGDLLLTAEFQRYTEQRPFTAVFCRKADPETKGKVESVVKYVKNNFLRGRHYSGIEELNQLALNWLSRTGNAKPHQTTWLIPQKEWEIERDYLLLYQPISPPVSYHKATYYKVRKDNTIAYKGNFYTVPTGTYKDTESRIGLDIKEGQLIITDLKGELIGQHELCVLKGKTIRNNNHLRDKASSIEEKENQIMNHLANDNRLKIYLQTLRSDKPRYYHDHLRLLISLLDSVSVSKLLSVIYQCQELKIYNIYSVKQLAGYQQKQEKTLDIDLPFHVATKQKNLHYREDLQPRTSNIEDYESIL